MCSIRKFFLFIVLAGTSLAAQTSHHFQGVVKDGEDAAVTGAHVTASYLQKKIETSTDEQGRFQFEIPADTVFVRIDGSFIVPIERG